MPEQIISASGTAYGLVINSEGRALVDLGGDITISGISIDSIVIQETSPISEDKNNPAFLFNYVTSGTSTGVTGSRISQVVMFIDAGSFVNTILYSNNRILSIGSWA